MDRGGCDLGSFMLFVYSARRFALGQPESANQHQLSLGFQRPPATALGKPKPVCRPLAGRVVAGRLSAHALDLVQDLQCTLGSDHSPRPKRNRKRLVGLHPMVGFTPRA
jgi:hypothetical protein